MTTGAGGVLVATPADAAPGPLLTQRVSVSTSGEQGTGTPWSAGKATVSSDGRYVAFTGPSSLAPGAAHPASDVFVRDTQTNQTRRVSISSGGVAGDQSSAYATISANGRYVAFYSSAANLVAEDNNNHADLFVHDLQTGATELVTVSSTGAQANMGPGDLAISADGRRVTFVSGATNLVPGDTNNRSDIFVRDLDAGTTARVSVASNGTQATGESYEPDISGDGTVVAFTSEASNLVSGDTNGVTDVFVHDLTTGTTRRGNLDSTGAQNGFGQAPSLDADGSMIAFHTRTALVPADTNDTYDVYIRDLDAATTTRVSVTDNGSQFSGGSFYPSLSGDGTRMSFLSNTPGLAPGDTNDLDVLVRDLSASSTDRYSVANDGSEANTAPWHIEHALSADGQSVVFDSSAPFTSDDTNGVHDIYLVGSAGADSTAPQVELNTDPGSPDGDGGWFRSTFDVRWLISDPDSNVTQRTECAEQEIAEDTTSTGLEILCSATSSGGTTEASETVFRDATRPTIESSVAPASPDGENGWYVTAPEVSFDCADQGSGIADCTESEALGDGADQSVPGEARDVAGNTAQTSVQDLDVDLTDPEVTCEESPTFTQGAEGTVSATVSDSGSGPEEPQVSAPADTSTAGPGSVELTGADNAGRQTTVSCDYTVESEVSEGYTFTGFLWPLVNPPETNDAQVGERVRMRFQLDGFHGLDVVDAAGSRRVSCASSAMPLPGARHGTRVRYYSRIDTYVYTFRVRERWQDTCRVVSLRLDDGSIHQARFRFTG